MVHEAHLRVVDFGQNLHHCQYVFYQKTCIPLKLILFANSHVLDYLQSRKLCLLKPYLIVFFYSNLYIYHKPYHVESRLYQDHFCKYNMYFRIRIITFHFANCKVNSNCSDCIVVNHTKMVKQFFPKRKFNLSNYIFPHNILNWFIHCTLLSKEILLISQITPKMQKKKKTLHNSKKGIFTYGTVSRRKFQTVYFLSAWIFEFFLCFS